jgi:hypothetical protein
MFLTHPTLKEEEVATIVNAIRAVFDRASR